MGRLFTGTASYMEPNEVIQEIEKIEKWYRGVGKGFTGLTELIYRANHLGILSSTLSTLKGEAHKEWLDSRAVYEKKLNTHWVLLGSQHKAKAKCHVEYETVKTAEGIYRIYSDKFDGVKNVLDRMNQMISFLKMEWEADHLAKAIQGKVEELEKRLNDIHPHLS